MRIIQTVNDTIRLLFNPKTEIFCLSDFLLVRDNNENFLAQVVEIYDDKFDQEANVAKIRLVYRIVNGNEIVPYDNYTPSRECEVAKIKQSEIEKCINLGKKTISIGVSAKTKEKTEINTNFLDNNCVIFSDKFEQTNQIFENLAPRLASYKHVLILDFSGTCSPDGANSFLATETFRMPLSAETIDYIQQKTLLRAKLETQVILGDVFEEVKKYLLTTEDNYIPFARFIKVIQSQCKQTPSVELLVLISWLKKYSRMGIFAKNRREFEMLFKSIERNKITTVDFSNVKIEWQKEYVEYITNKIDKDIFVLVRLNDNNINNDIINNIYLKKKNLSFIPCFSYGYKKAPYLMEFAQNYILMPTLNPKRDFAHANFQIESLNKDSYMIYGEDTKEFIFTLENEVPPKKQIKEEDTKGKMFISLNLQLEDMTPFELRPNNFEIKQKDVGQKRLSEEIRLIDVLAEREQAPNYEQDEVNEEAIKIEQHNAAVFKETLTGETGETVESYQDEYIEQYEEINQNASLEDVSYEAQVVLGEDELDYFEQEETPIIQEAIGQVEAPSENEDIIEAEVVEENIEDINAIEAANKKLQEFAQEKEEIAKDEAKEPVLDETKDAVSNIIEEVKETAKDAKITEETSIAKEESKEESKEIQEEALNDEPEEVKKPKKVAKKEQKEQEALKETIEPQKADNETKEETKEESKEKTSLDEVQEEAAEDDKKLEESEIKPEKEPETETKNESGIESENESEIKPDEKEGEAEELSEEEKIDKKFEEIMSDTEAKSAKDGALQIDEKVSIDLNKIKKEIKKQDKKLPIFNEEEENEAPAVNFSEGDKVIHDEYGSGEIMKVIKYGQRCLLQIEFPEAGKRLLDPRIAKLKLAEA